MSVELDSLLTHSPEARRDRVRIAGREWPSTA
jgi:hypothetical protein